MRVFAEVEFTGIRLRRGKLLLELLKSAARHEIFEKGKLMGFVGSVRHIKESSWECLHKLEIQCRRI